MPTKVHAKISLGLWFKGVDYRPLAHATFRAILLTLLVTAHSATILFRFAVIALIAKSTRFSSCETIAISGCLAQYTDQIFLLPVLCSSCALVLSVCGYLHKTVGVLI